MLLLQGVENAFTIAGLSPYAKKMIWGGLLLLFMAMNYFFRRIVARRLTAVALRQEADGGAHEESRGELRAGGR